MRGSSYRPHPVSEGQSRDRCLPADQPPDGDEWTRAQADYLSEWAPEQALDRSDVQGPQ